MKNLVCQNIVELLPLYIDQMLSDDKSEAVEKHINTCLQCQNELDFMKGIVAAAKTIPEIDLPPQFQARLHQKLVATTHNPTPAKGKSVFFGWKSWKTYSAIAACAAIIALSISALSVLPSLEDGRFQINAPETMQPTPQNNNNSKKPGDIAAPGTEETATPASMATAPPTAQSDTIVHEAVRGQAEEKLQTQSEPLVKEQSDIQEQPPTAMPKATPTPSEEVPAPESSRTFTKESEPESLSFDAGLFHAKMYDGTEDMAPNHAMAGSGNAKVAMMPIAKIKNIFELSFTKKSLIKAKEILTPFSAKGNLYKVPADDYFTIMEKLTSLEGYRGLSDISEDKIHEYNQLQLEYEDAEDNQKQTVQKKIDNLEDEISYYYIYIQ